MPRKQKQTKKMPADNLVSTAKEDEIELKEDELNRVVGGALWDPFPKLGGGSKQDVE